MSGFIENSKHHEMTAAVEEHFGMRSAAKNYNASVPLPQPAKVPDFGHPNTGLNYMPREWAGTTPDMVKQYGK